MNYSELPPILIDTREPSPHPWEPYLSGEIIRGTLETGDFSLPGCAEWICIERKTLDDLIGCLCQHRERFTRELQRASRVRDFYVVCEGSYSDLWTGNYRSHMHPRAAWESVIALQQRYGIPFLMAGNVEIAAKLTESILMRWYREHVKALEAAHRAMRPLRVVSDRGKLESHRVRHGLREGALQPHAALQ